MPTNTPKKNKQYCKAYYERVKANPVKYLEFRAKKNAYRKRKYDESQEGSTVGPQVIHSGATVDPQGVHKDEPVILPEDMTKLFEDMTDDR